MWACVAASAAGGAVAHAHPSGSRPADMVLTGAFAGLVSLTGAYARRLAWLITAAVAVAAASGGVAVAFAVAAVFIGFVAVALNARSLGLGAAAAALAVQALLRLPHFVFQGAPTLLAAIAVVPLFASAYRYAPKRARRQARLFALYGGVVCIALFGRLDLHPVDGQQHIAVARRDGHGER